MKEFIKAFKALSDPNRLRIVKMLEIRPLCVCEITSVLKLASSTVSKHLSLLHDAGLIENEKRGKWVFYALNHSPDKGYLDQLLSLLAKSLPEEPLIKSDAATVEQIDTSAVCGI